VAAALRPGLAAADAHLVEARSPAQTLHERHRRMVAGALLLIGEAAIFALAGVLWWPLSFLAFVPIVVLARATLVGGRLDPLPLRSGIRGEERVAELLAGLEPDGYVAIHELDIGRGDADHVVVGPTGVFVVETKEWNGRFFPRRGHLMFNQRPADQVVSQVTVAALAVKHRLEQAGIEVFVQAVIASTKAKVYHSPLRLGHVTVMEADDLPAFVRARRTTIDADTASRALRALLDQDAA
jgi:hypothetical protein